MNPASVRVRENTWELHRDKDKITILCGDKAGVQTVTEMRYSALCEEDWAGTWNVDVTSFRIKRRDNASVAVKTGNP